MGNKTTREYILNILVDIDKNNAYSNLTINKCLKDSKLEAIDRRFVTEIVYGVLENKLYLDYIISLLSTIKIKKLNTNVINILRMGLYQIIFLDKIPEFAAVNESVKLGKKYDFRSFKFINGVLRSYIRKKDTIKIPSFENNPITHLSIKYSHPIWLIEKWVKEFGMEDTINLLKANNETPPLTARINTLLINKENFKKELAKENIKVSEGKYIQEAVEISNVTNIGDLTSYKKGYFQIQDESSMFVAHVLDPKPGEYVLDVCSAPGGKATHIAQLMENSGRILARDIHPHKLKLIENNVDRLKINIIETQCFNAKELDQNSIEKFDKVLVDAPCSGLGIIRRKPELKFSKKPDDIGEITALQLEILTNSSKYVKKGGFLVYSTCTITNEENSEVVEKFLKQNSEFEIINAVEYLPKLNQQGPYIKTFPHINGIDGFFISKLRKKL